ncbi:MAG: hypothetical protein ACK5Y8_04880 [Betaproteobacteria bacterium]|nr:hypothetical protein [Rubrivivax sp.]
MNDPIGGAWLIQRYALQLVMPPAVASRIGGRRATHAGRPTTVETYVESMRPAQTLRGNLTFHLKHEAPHFELLSRLFASCDAGEIAACLYEFFTGHALPVPSGKGGGYPDAINAQDLVAASPERAELNKRWRIRDNMPGTRACCPMIVKAQVGATAFGLDVRAIIHDLEVEFGEELLLRYADWMTLRESRASFEIEGEADTLADPAQGFPGGGLSRQQGAFDLPGHVH